MSVMGSGKRKDVMNSQLSELSPSLMIEVEGSVLHFHMKIFPALVPAAKVTAGKNREEEGGVSYLTM